ncbi:DUF4185 domain-containing protein [Streptomyces xanthochromogenes]|uniref:DUF4185 domain-containing protein n=1 Tax=Streptomyces xanthochromogenes TaxID=67384 RepID=UPI00341585F1
MVPSGPVGGGSLVVRKVGDLTGPGITTPFRMEAADLGIPVRAPDGHLLFVFGDTFEEARVGGGWWRSPVALRGRASLSGELGCGASGLGGGVAWTAAVGGRYAQQLRPYSPGGPAVSTVLPTDVITLGGDMYLHVAVHQGFGNVRWSEIWCSRDSGETWHPTAARFPGALHGGMFQLLTWALADDGYVYVLSTGFQRDKPALLHRVRADRITDPSAYRPWGRGAAGWAWGNPPTPVLDGRVGEMCLRPLDGRWLLTWFDEGGYRIDALVLDAPVSVCETTAEDRVTLIRGTAWGREDDAHVAQLYGGYVIPGSTLDDLHLTVSQWNTEAGWPYRVVHFRVHGLTAVHRPGH